MTFDDPIRVRALPYRGRDPRRLEKLREQREASPRIEAWIAAKRVKGEPRAYGYGTIAGELMLDEELVSLLLQAASGGSSGGDSGITI